MRLPSQAENVWRAGAAAQGGQPHGTALGAHGSMAGTPRTSYDASFPAQIDGGDEKALPSRRQAS